MLQAPKPCLQAAVQSTLGCCGTALKQSSIEHMQELGAIPPSDLPNKQYRITELCSQQLGRSMDQSSINTGREQGGALL